MTKLKKTTTAWLLVLCMIVSIAASAIYVHAGDVVDYDAMSMEELFNYEKSLTWVFAGDSITHNGSWSQGMNSYSEWFEQYLYDINRGDDSVVLTAWGGADIYDFQTYENTPNGNGTKADPGMGIENFVTKYNPDVVFIKLGMNDRGKTTETYVEYYNKMLDSIYEIGKANGKKPKIVLLTPSPMSGESIYNKEDTTQDSVWRFQKALTGIAQERGLLLCDLVTAFTNEAVALGSDYHRTFFSDPSDGGIHPNASGQYLIFKSLSKTIGIYDEDMAIYQLTYDDINSSALYVEGTNGVIYDGGYGESTIVDDNTEMDKVIPNVGKISLLASVDFTSANGVFNKGTDYATSTKFDLTDEALLGKGALTFEEAQSLENEFSIVFRAKINPAAKTNQALLFISSNGDANWNNAVSIGIPSTSNNIYYEVRNANTEKTNSPNQFTMSDTNETIDGQWHTIAIVQTKDAFNYYIDGELHYTAEYVVNSGYDIGSGFTSESTFVAQIGAYGQNAETYGLDGSMDYFQLYKGALSESQVKALATKGGIVLDDTQAMNDTMVTLDGKDAMASVDFNSTTGDFKYNNTDINASTVDLTQEANGVNTLTLQEVQSLGKEYTIVFRSRLDSPADRSNMPIIYLSTKAGIAFGSPGHNCFMLGIPGSSNIYYGLRENNTSCGSLNGGTTNFGNLQKVMNDGKWHTVAVVQKTDGMTVYVDGVAYPVKASNGNAVVLNKTIGELFAATNELDAAVGRYDTTNKNWKTQGKFDYWQLYGSALTADEIATLSEADAATDAEEMNATMPTLSEIIGQNVIVSVDLDKTNGTFVGGSDYNTATRVDLTDSAICDDVLTLEEAQGLTNEFSIVFRANLDVPHAVHQAIFFMSPDGTARWLNAVAVGAPGTSHTAYYEIRNNSTEKTSSTNTITLQGTNTTVNGGWHTIAIVQSATSYTYYVDGVAVYTSDSIKVNAGYNIGDAFQNATDFAAHIGSYAQGDAKTYNLKGAMDYLQVYNTALTAEQVSSFVDDNDASNSSVDWTQTIKENYTWGVVGAEQVAGYEGPVVNRSLFRLLDNAMRGGANAKSSQRDIRLYNMANAGYTMQSVLANYDDIIGNHNPDVLLIVPEVSQVYADGYTHSDTLVAEYKTAVIALLAQSDAKAKILWTPLASGNATLNGYLDDYANAIREIASADSSIYFFDANRFMNDNMQRNATLARNWFEEDMYISPLGAIDVAYAFYTLMGQSTIAHAELETHNLRDTSDKRTFKGPYIRDYIAAGVTVNGTSVSIDVSAIKDVYGSIENLRFVVLPEAGIGNYSDKLISLSDVTTVTQNGNLYTFEAPCSDPVIAVYGDLSGRIYRYKDLKLDVTTSNVIEEKTPNPDGAYLDALTVVGAPSIGYNKNTTSYDVTLYQYQRDVQILAKAQDGLTITVNGMEVKSGKYSHIITVEDSESVVVKVSGKVNGTPEEATYTLHLTRQEYPDIIITEVMQDGYGNYDVSGGDNYELIEIYNASGKDLNLLDYSIGYKKDYPYTTQQKSEGKWPYYFTGNNQAFQATSSASATYTGINQITKYSTYWNGGSNEEPDEVVFKADSTMVIWVKFTPNGASASYGESLTYQTLIAALEAHADTYTLTVDVDGTKTAVVPEESQLVVAEIPMGAPVGSQTARNNKLVQNAMKNFYLENHGASNDESTTRSWLFVLKDSAVQASNGSITEAGDDIISAGKFVRLSGTNKLSSVFYYDVERGMALIKDDTKWDSYTGIGHTSSEQGYANLTSFGAIEYWQKPYDLHDTTAPTFTNNTPGGVYSGTEVALDFTLTDNNDVRYMELYVRKDKESDWTKVTEDFVLESGMKNAGVSSDIKSKNYTYDLGEITETTEYYGFVIDGNNNKTSFGTADAPLTVAIGEKGSLDINMSIVDETGAADSSVEADVEITVEKGNAIVDFDATYDILLGDAVVGELTLTGGKLVGTITLANGEKVSIKGLPEGVTYTVKVSVPEGYEVATGSLSEVSGNITATAAGVVSFSLKETQTQVTPPGGDDSGNQPGGDDSGNQPGGDDGGNQPGGDDSGNQPGGDDNGNQPGGDDSGNQPGGDDSGNKPSGDENKPSGDENKPSGDENKPSGDENKPSGDENKPSGDGNQPNEKPNTNDYQGKMETDLSEKIPLTKEEQEAVANGAKVEIYVELKDISTSISKSDKKLVESNLGDAKIGLHLDINLYKKVGNASAVKVTNTNETVEISFIVPDELINTDKSVKRIYQIIRVHDGVADILDVDFDSVSKELSFETNAFSSYTLVYTDVATQAPAVPVVGIIVAIVIVAVVACGVGFVVYRKKAMNK